MSNYGKLDELLGEYWNAAYKEGLDGRYHDTVDSEAQRTLNSIHEELEKQLAERDAALARCVEFVSQFRIRRFRLREDSAETIDTFVASLPTSAQATAKVLAAARWISCDEKMPDLTGRDDSHVPGGAPATLYSERVLVFDGTVRIDNLIQAEGSPETRTFYIGSRKPVTHWMPLPEPPEAIREEQEGK